MFVRNAAQGRVVIAARGSYRSALRMIPVLALVLVAMAATLGLELWPALLAVFATTVVCAVIGRIPRVVVNGRLGSSAHPVQHRLGGLVRGDRCRAGEGSGSQGRLDSLHSHRDATVPLSLDCVLPNGRIHPLGRRGATAAGRASTDRGRARNQRRASHRRQLNHFSGSDRGRPSQQIEVSHDLEQAGELAAAAIRACSSILGQLRDA